MKRQSKPFSVEIKRSRRSPAPSPSSPPAGIDGGRNDANKTASQKKRASKAPHDAELIVPAFLQSDKASPRSATKAISKERDGVFASKTVLQNDDRQPSGVAKASDERARPRILPSLTSGYGVEPEAEAKPALKRQGRKTASGAAPKDMRASRRKEKESARPARAGAAQIDAGPRRKSAVQQRAVATSQSNPVRKDALVAKNAFPAQTRFGQRASISMTAKSKDDAPRDDLALRPSKRRSLLKRSRDDASSLPRGEHWKRRLHPRTW